MPGVVGGTAGDDGKGLDWKDYLAMFIALLQTVALPMLLLVALILAALVVLRLLH
ncbi:MAG TPA: hypothetical protein VND40_05370 [Nitrososphaerales archaeon]|nr:hypothetical protein [Nitrososphaerales archaeon]